MADKAVTRSWWAFAWRGGLALAFGILALVWPGLTLLWLVALFAAFALLGGGASVVNAIKNRRSYDDWWVMLLLGLVSLAAGVIAVIHPDLTALVLVLLMGANAIVTGILDIVLAIRLRRAIRGEWVLMLAGLVGIAFGIFVFLFPAAGALAMVWLISLYAMITGFLLLFMAWRVRKGRAEETWQRAPEGRATA